MITVEFRGYVPETRLATFNVDGVDVTRQVADDVQDLDAHFMSLATGLIAEVRHTKVLQGIAPFAEEHNIIL